MNTKNILFALLLLLTGVRYATAQQTYWAMPDKKWSFSPVSPTNTAIPGASTNPYINSNAVYDKSGNMLFYVVDNRILTPTSAYAGTLLPFYVNGTFTPADGNGIENQKNFQSVGPEISIVPVPGHCAAFYVIYTMSNHFTASDFVMYMKVDCSFGGVAVTSPTAGGGHAAYPINVGNNYAGKGLAVSKRLGTTYDRYLFIGGKDQIVRYSITSGGIASPTLISSATDEPTMFGGGINNSHELELSSDQQWLAWGNTALNKLFAINLNASYTKVSGASKSYSITDIKGLEFNGSGTKIYVSASGSGANGISYVSLSGTTVTTIASSSSMNNTYLEYAKNTRIYGVNNSGNLVGFLDATTPVLGTPIIGTTINSNAPYMAYSQYRLIDQVDGDIYAQFFGTPNLFVNCVINGSTPIVCTTPLQTFQCKPITLTNSSLGASSYKIELYSSPDACGTYSLVHSTGTVSTFPSDAKNLPGGATGTWLQTHTGYFKIVLYGYNTCGQSQVGSTYYFNVAVGPSNATAFFNTLCKTKDDQTLTVTNPPCIVPVNQEFTYYGNTGTTSCGGVGSYKFPMEHTSVSTPNKVGRTFTNFVFNGISAGTGSSAYNVRIKAESWDGSNWTLMGTDPLGYDLGMSPTQIELEDLVGGAFLDAVLTPNGSIYRITVSVINECGTYSSSQIIQIDDLSLRMSAFNGEQETAASAINFSAYPNPVSEEITFRFNAAANDVVDITLHDVSGRKVADLINGEKAVEGENTYRTSVNKLEAGSYSYKVTINGVVYSGKLTKQ